MPTTITAHEQAISRIFSNDYVFRIPSYQRPYAWKVDQARDLFDDLHSFMTSHKSGIEDMPPYFLGSIVLIKNPDLPNADVVDGQQRLTTLTILLAAIRANVDANSASAITQLLYEKGNQILGTQDRFRLSLRPRDQEFFQQYVQRQGGFEKLLELNTIEIDSQRNLRDNALLYSEKIKGLSEEVRRNLAQFIVTRCYLVSVATPDLDSAYRIFSVLNSRGLDLSPTDILKADIIGEVPANKRDEYTDKWENCEEELGREGFGELFSHIRMVYRQAKPQGTLLKEFKEHVTNGMSSIDFIDNVLLPMVKVYRYIVDADYASSAGAETVNSSLKWLNRLEFKDWIPPALAFSVREQNKPDLMGRFFEDLERLGYGMLIMKAGVNERIERFSRLTNAIQKGVDIWTDTQSLQLNPEDQYTIFQTLDGPFYRELSARARSAVLLRLDALISDGSASYNYDTVTVEHVLPQNPAATSEWLQWFPEPNIRVSQVHKLGNLALLTRKKNSAASNYEFERKKTAYFAKGGVSPFVLTTQVLTHAQWTPPIIEERQKALVGALEKHWRLENRKSSLHELLGDIVTPNTTSE